ncbi:MAG: hypothetical protein JRJ06_03620 [Deltaproteobacteria bacterium]|nr:hypothetical protein [Deltaproteobacteria bacterium]
MTDQPENEEELPVSGSGFQDSESFQIETPQIEDYNIVEKIGEGGPRNLAF